jgi:hypothetical protein
MNFLNEALSQDVAHIDNFSLSGDAFGHFVFMCRLSTFLFHMDSTSFFFFPVSFSGFQRESYVGMWGHHGSMIVGVFSRPLNKASSSTTNILWRYRPFLYGGLCPICFFR